MKHVGDITKLNGDELEPVDCVCGGSPCQNFSKAGNRKGLGGDESVLFYQQIRVVKELRERDRAAGRTGRFIRPRYMVWENVPGALSSPGGSRKGEDFKAVLEESVRIAEPEAPDVPVPDKGWPKSGLLYDVGGKWSVAWRLHDAQFWGVPQRRKRIALVADFGGLSAPEILFERKGLCWDTDESCPTGQRTAARAEGSVGAADDEGTSEARVDQEKEAIKAYCNQGGIAVVEPIVYNGENITSPINKAIPRAGDPCHTIGTDSRNWLVEPRTYQSVTAPLMANSHPGNYCGQDAYQDMLVTSFSAGCFGKNEQGVGPIRASGGDYSGGTETLVAANIVRRLTPLECERLQGYPDGWTDIGDWVDSKGKKHKAADSPRHKAMGNSIALPFWQWLIKRISAQYERDATMGSLFDGIGGFPYCWERVNGKGSTRWASEIEEFPMAVTKVRFGDR